MQFLNSYFEILLNPEKGAANREVAGPLNPPAEEAACLQDLGLPRNLSPPHTGWVGPHTDSGPGTHSAATSRRRQPRPGEHSVSL